MRRIMRLLEDASAYSPGTLERFIAQHPDAVSNNPQMLKAALADHAETGARFAWAIGRLPDGRFISLGAKALERWGVPIVAKGTHEDL